MTEQRVLWSGLDILRDSLVPIAEATLKKSLGEDWIAEVNRIRAREKNRPPPIGLKSNGRVKWSPDLILNVIAHGELWTRTFQPFLEGERGRVADLVRCYIFETLAFRRAWAHVEKEDSDPERFFDDILRIQRAFGCSDEHQDKIRQLMLKAGYKRTHPVEEVAEQFRSLGPLFVTFWQILRVAYKRWKEGHPHAPQSLDVLVDETPFPSELPLPEPADVYDWAQRATIFRDNLLWDFASSVYPARQLDGTDPPSILTDDEWAAFHMPCRREIANRLQNVGFMLGKSEIPAYAIPHLMNNEKLVKLSAYLSVALTLRTTNKGPDKPGLFNLYKLIQLARAEAPFSGWPANERK